jgi:hypothetical protein
MNVAAGAIGRCRDCPCELAKRDLGRLKREDLRRNTTTAEMLIGV